MRYAGVPDNQMERALGRLFVLLCERYDLDPALRQLEVINAGGGLQCYITAAGYRHIALRSGELDGITIVDASEGEHGWRASVQVWKKGCSHAFDGRAGCGFKENKSDPEAQAITRATRRALINAFDAVPVPAEYVGLMNGDEAQPNVESSGGGISGLSAGGTDPPPEPPADVEALFEPGEAIAAVVEDDE